ncbi:tetratricopeptide repeat protein [Desulfosarcina sp.]|uniref:tetratricopeptide repeat protein n=1 Tax=Desulfosarcina sp. TaxID=2027861 RepID=UPI003970B0D7
MAKGTSTRKQLLKEPDQFITFSGKLIAFGRSNAKMILICTGVVLVLLITAATVRQVSERNENRASELVEKAVNMYSAALQDTDPKTAYDRVKADFNAIFNGYGSKNAAKIARILYGDICYHGGDVDTAIVMYTRALDDFTQFPALKNLILSGLGHAYVFKKDYDQAIRYFEMIASDKDKTMQSGALFNLAWLYDAGGDKAKSTSMYKQLLADFPDSLYSELVKETVSG